MRGMHQTIVRGHVGRDPEQSFTGKGAPVTKTSVAVNEKWRDRSSGELKTRTQWYPVTFVGRSAEIAASYLKSGSHVMVMGRMRSYQVEADSGKKTIWELLASEFDMLDARPAAPMSAAAPKVVGSDVQGDLNDDIPF